MPTATQRPSRSAALTLLLSTTLPLAAQCPSSYTGAFGAPGLGGTARAMVAWDPDGAGPQPPVLVIGGTFTVAGPVACTGIARFDPAARAWAALPAPPLPSVSALAVLGTGQLVAACDSGTVPPSGPTRIVVLTGSSWGQLGNDFDATVRGLAVGPSGELVAGGDFAQHGGATLPYLARWNGTAWAGLGAAPTGPVTAFTSLPTGELLVGGAFDAIGGIAADGIAAWNGTSWSAFGSLGSSTTALAVSAGGAVFAGNGAGLQRWNGAAWTAVPGLDASPFPAAHISALAPGGGGTLLVGGNFHTVNGVASLAVAGYDPATNQWAAFGSGIGNSAPFAGQIAAFAAGPGGSFHTAGAFLDAGGLDLAGVAQWTGSQWCALHDAPLPKVTRVLPLGGGRALVGGWWSRSLGNLACPGIAEWDGTGWQALGAGLFGAGIGPQCTALARLPGDEVLVAGDFQSAGGVPAPGLARWNLTSRTWSAVTGVRGFFLDLLTLPDGRVVVGGDFQIGGQPAVAAAIFDGTTWQPFAAGGPAFARRLARAANGDILVVAIDDVFRWNGSQWSLEIDLPPGHLIFALAVTPAGHVLVGGREGGSFGGSQRGFVVTPLQLEYGPSGSSVNAMHLLPDGDVWVAGDFVSLGAIAANGLLRYTGGLLQPVAQDGYGIATFATDPDGGVWVGGYRAGYGGTATSGVTVLRSACPALALPSGVGCAGSGGLPELTARQLPWLGGVQSLRATGLPSTALGVPVLGLAPLQLPLAPLVAAAMPGCDLLVSPDALGLVVAQQGAAEFPLAIPDTTTLLGVVFHQQLVAFGIGAGGTIDEVTVTPRLTLVVGDL
jgi:hypothetical protein